MSSIGLYLAFALKAQAPAKVSNEHFEVVKRWNLPAKLNEISGIAWLSNDQIACVEDEDGIIFIYDLQQNKIIQSVDFAGKGDFEGLALNQGDAYAIRSDGLLFEIPRFRESDPKSIPHKTVFSSYNNIESLFYDAANHRLLTMPKDKDLSQTEKKGIYVVELPSFHMDNTPKISVDFNHPDLTAEQIRLLKSNFNPSDIAIHPKTKEILILQGKTPFLYFLESDGRFKKGLPLPIAGFPQPEGICFSPEGRLFISNESTTSGPNIIEIRLKNPETMDELSE